MNVLLHVASQSVETAFSGNPQSPHTMYVLVCARRVCMVQLPPWCNRSLCIYPTPTFCFSCLRCNIDFDESKKSAWPRTKTWFSFNRRSGKILCRVLARTFSCWLWTSGHVVVQWRGFEVAIYGWQGTMVWKGNVVSEREKTHLVGLSVFSRGLLFDFICFQPGGNFWINSKDSLVCFSTV